MSHSSRSERSPGSALPASDTQIAPDSTFFIEVWATNSGEPLDGLAGVHVDLSYNPPALAEAVPPTQEGGFFPVHAVTPVFDGPAGLVGDIEFQTRSFCIGACEPGGVPSDSTSAAVIASLSLVAIATLTLRGRRVARA